MKPDMKNQLKQMKKERYGYIRIAKELGLTLSVVRYACSKINDEDLLEGHCEKYGLKIISIKGKKRKRFSSDQRRWDWWNKEFTTYGNKNRVYYSHDCYIKFKLNKG